MSSRTLADLREDGVTLQPHEAVAIAQQLIEPSCHGNPAEAEAAVGPPSAENVILHPDGCVECGCGATPAVSEIAIFLQSLMPDESPRVPGGLRYAIARALLEVEAPPFDSLDELSQALGRFERGDRCDVVRRLLARADGVATGAQLAVIDGARLARAEERGVPGDRRRLALTASDLRRELREADRLRYEERAALACRCAADTPPARRRWLVAASIAAAACVGGGVVEIAHQGLPGREAEPALVQNAPAPIPAAPSVVPAGSPIQLPAPAAQNAAVGQSETNLRGTAGRAAVRNANADVTAKPHLRKAVTRTHARPRKSEPSLIKQVVTFKWLRDAFKS